jgi:hypothetical protein
MQDSDIPAITNKLMQACKAAAAKGKWKAPLEPGMCNYHCCPMMFIYNYELSFDEVVEFMRGYDGRPSLAKTNNDNDEGRGYDGRPSLAKTNNDNDEGRFYILGQGFRKIADTVGFGP